MIHKYDTRNNPKRTQNRTCFYKGIRKRMISNHLDEAEIDNGAKQLEAQPKNGFAFKRNV